MELIFYTCLSVLLYIYIGYPVLVGICAKLFGKPPRRGQGSPSVTLLIPAYNEAKHIEAKLKNSLALDYPRELLQILVASDGSTDATDEIVARYAGQGVELQAMRENIGKASMLSMVIPRLRSEIIVLSDASGLLAKDAVRLIMENFADPDVGCASGLYRLGLSGDDSMRDEGEGLYWRYETWVKQKESDLHSILGAHGAFYALRKELFRPLTSDSVNDDYIIAMRVVEQGYRSVFDRRAECVEPELVTVKGEFARRRRIAVGNCQQIVMLRKLFHPRYGWVAFAFFSHKLLRTFAPFFMAGVLVSSFLLPLWQAVFWVGAQALFYGTALWGYMMQRMGWNSKLAMPVLYFCAGNLAIMAGVIKYLTGGGKVEWERARSD